jgi:hypothetical protein
MAALAIHQHVSPHKREAVLMIADRVQRSLPSFDRMATLTVGAELPAMNVGVTIRATGAGILEDHAGVALSTSHLFVHFPQRIPRLIMIEFRLRPDWPPTNAGVAVLARDSQGAVGIRNLGLGRASRLLRNCKQRHDQYDGCKALSQQIHSDLQLTTAGNPVSPISPLPAGHTGSHAKPLGHLH